MDVDRFKIRFGVYAQVAPGQFPAMPFNCRLVNPIIKESCLKADGGVVDLAHAESLTQERTRIAIGFWPS